MAHNVKNWQESEKYVSDTWNDRLDDSDIEGDTEAGTRVQPGSGNKWGARGDLVTQTEYGQIVHSVKFTKRQSMRLSREMIEEIDKIAMEQGDGMWSLDIVFEDGPAVAVLPLEDYIELEIANIRLGEIEGKLGLANKWHEEVE